MLLTLTTTHRPATDLGYLLAKHPDRLHSFTVPSGRAHVFWPEATAARATAALLVEMDTVGLVRAGSPDEDAPLAGYVNDRPYAASSFLSVAMSRVFSTAFSGRCRERQALADAPIPLEATIHAVHCHGGAALARRLFEPLGYGVEPTEVDRGAFGLPSQLAPGEGRLLDLTLSATVRLADLLGHVYVLVPVLDDAKHYWVGQDEVDKLLERGEAWLADHPERELVVRRYLKHRAPLIRSALERLDPEEHEDDEAPGTGAEDALEKPIALDQQRLAAVHEALKASGARAVADLGCGEGKLLGRLVRDKQFERVVGLDVSARALAVARRRLSPDRVPEPLLRRLVLLQGSVTYRDSRLADLDAVALVEVIEHLEPERLPAVEQALFASARPGTVVLTTPNAEYNVRFALTGFRHRDHRFEWTRAELAAWASGVAARRGYTVDLGAIGPVDPDLGAPTQMAVFTRTAR